MHTVATSGCHHSIDLGVDGECHKVSGLPERGERSSGIIVVCLGHSRRTAGSTDVYNLDGVTHTCSHGRVGFAIGRSERGNAFGFVESVARIRVVLDYQILRRRHVRNVHYIHGVVIATRRDSVEVGTPSDGENCGSCRPEEFEVWSRVCSMVFCFAQKCRTAGSADVNKVDSAV